MPWHRPKFLPITSSARAFGDFCGIARGSRGQHEVLAVQGPGHYRAGIGRNVAGGAFHRRPVGVAIACANRSRRRRHCGIEHLHRRTFGQGEWRVQGGDGRFGAGVGGCTSSLARDSYLAIYAAAKKQDSTLAMLGFSKVTETQALLSGNLGWAHLDDYVDSLAADATTGVALRALDPAACNRYPSRQQDSSLRIKRCRDRSAGGSTGGGHGGGSAGGSDRGITLHLLGGAVLYQQLHASCPPYVVVFQGNGYAVGVIAGMGAGTPNDRAWPGLLVQAVPGPMDTTAAVADDKPVLEVADPDTSLRVVNWAGDAINCRRGDMLRLPLDGRICYLLEAGAAEDLVAGLRTADLRHFTPVEITALRLMPPDVDHAKPMVALRVRNATDHEVKGSIRVAGATEGLDFIAISPGKYLEIALPVDPTVGHHVALDVTV